MKRPSLARVALAAASAAVVATVTGFAATSAGASAAWPPGHGLPPHVFAPYFETYDTSGDLAALSQQSGARYLSLAFLQTDAAGLVHRLLERRHQPRRSPRPASAADIAAIQARGGNVIPSFGGYTADTTGTEHRRQLHQRQRDRPGLREPHHHLPRPPHRPRHRGRLADQHGRHQPPQRGHRPGRGLGRGARHGGSSSPTRCRRFPTGLDAGRAGRAAERGRRRRHGSASVNI